MYNLMTSKESGGPFKVDTIQKASLNPFITNQYFVWTCLVLFLNSKNWKRPVIAILVLHWFLRCVGDIFLNSFDFIPQKYTGWPFSNEGWFYCYGIASVFWYLSEIFGDWYPLLRTKAIIKNNQKLRLVYISCILYNIVKLVQMYFYIRYVPFRSNVVNDKGLSQEEFDKYFYGLYNEDMGYFKTLQWANVLTQLIMSFIYDVSVIRALKTHLFDKIKAKENIQDKELKFLTRFKQISEYRIVLSMVATIVAFPVMLSFTIVIFIQFVEKRSIISDQSADTFRQAVLSINYTLMYIDQILLRYYVDNNQKKNMNSSKHSTKSPTSTISPTTSISNDNSVNISVYQNCMKSYDPYKNQNMNQFQNQIQNNLPNHFEIPNGIDGTDRNFNEYLIQNSSLSNSMVSSYNPYSSKSIEKMPIMNDIGQDYTPPTTTISSIKPMEYYQNDNMNYYNNNKPRNYNY